MPYPSSPLDDRQQLLELLGSFWADTYAGNAVVASTLYAQAQGYAQEQLAFQEMLASVSRRTAPREHTETWYAWTIYASQMHTEAGTTWSGWSAPAGLLGAPVVVNRLSETSRFLAQGIDYYLQDGVLWLRTNPFDDPNMSPQAVYQNSQVIDNTLTLWFYRSRWDQQIIATQFGYVLGIPGNATEAYKRLVNAAFDALVSGPAAAPIQAAFAAICDIPLARGGDTVEAVFSDSRFAWVVSDQRAYALALDSNVRVAVGDVLTPGQTLSDGLRFYSFGNGEVPDDLTELTVGLNLLTAGYAQPLTFQNGITALTVEEDVDGYTKISFPLDGLDSDITAFWDAVHAAGVARGQTLAMLLDRRPVDSRSTQPTALALPAAVNPLGFLLQNVFRNNLFVVQVRPRLFGPNALGLTYAKYLLNWMRPQTTYILQEQD